MNQDPEGGKNILKHEQESRPGSGFDDLVPDVFRFPKTQSSKEKIFKLRWYTLIKVHFKKCFFQQMDVKFLSAMLLLYFLLPDTKHSKLASRTDYMA